MCTEAVSSTSQGVNVVSAVPEELQSCWHRSHLKLYNLDKAEGKVVSHLILRIIIFVHSFIVLLMKSRILVSIFSFSIQNIMNHPMSCMSSVILDLSLAFF